MTTLPINTPVMTPYGVVGTTQHPVLTTHGGAKVLVRLPINDKTEPHRLDGNCLTRGATKTGLWLFSQADIKAVKS